MVIKRIRDETECAIEKQCVFRQGRECMDQVFAGKQLCEKYLMDVKDVHWEFMI